LLLPFIDVEQFWF